MLFFYKRSGSDVGKEQTTAGNSSMYFIVVFGLTVLYGLVFYFLRARTHFLGDGYQILSILGSDTPFIKPTEHGEALVHLWVRSLIGAEGETSALLSYQAVSISAGLLFLIAVGLASRWLFDRTINRVLFWLGLASSGYMLLFFGYVENYSLFVLSVGVYSLLGLLVIKGKIKRWVILPIVALSIFFHTMGVTLIPSAIYLLLTNTKLGNRIARVNPKNKSLLALVVGLILLAVFYHFYTTDYFFRFAFVPLFENRFTAEEYTLFSVKHLLDYTNLLILLLPGLPLIVVGLFSMPVRKITRQREYRYLFILLVSTLGAAFILDPKLSMPRDWDLFSFIGVPLALFGYYLLLDHRKSIKFNVNVCILTIVLGFLSLFPRATSQVVPEVSVAHCRSYFTLDKVKNRNARRILISFYEKAGDKEMAQLETQCASAAFPERRLVDSAVVLINKGYTLEAVTYLHRVLQVNPLYADAWLNLGKCYGLLKHHDEAIEFIEIANGLNPYNAVFSNYLGSAYFFGGDYKRAEKALKQSVSLGPSYFEPLFRLIQLYSIQENWRGYYEYFPRFSSLLDASPEALQALGNFHLNRRDYRKAAEVYWLVSKRGLDTVYIDLLIEKHPQLKQYFLQQTVSPNSSDSQP